MCPHFWSQLVEEESQGWKKPAPLLISGAGTREPGPSESWLGADRLPHFLVPQFKHRSSVMLGRPRKARQPWGDPFSGPTLLRKIRCCLHRGPHLSSPGKYLLISLGARPR